METQRQLRTFDQVMKALGGCVSVALLTGRSPSSVSGWRRERKSRPAARRTTFPTVLYPTMIAELARRGYSAPMHLWGFEDEQPNADAA